MKVAVVGVTGLVGTVMREILEERNFPLTDFLPVASERSVGKDVFFKGKNYKVIGMQTAVDARPDIAIFSAGGSVSKEWAPRFAAVGTTVIDNSSAWRMDPDKKLIVPEVNADALTEEDKIIANPNCSTIQMVVALKPLQDAVGVRRVDIATYQSVSGAGKQAMDELFNQSRKFFVHEHDRPEVFSKQIVFNTIPQIDVFMDDGQTKEEWKMAVETAKIMETDIQVNATCVRVPVFIGHAVAVHAELNQSIEPKKARQLWRDMEGVSVIDLQSELEFVTQAEIAGEDDVYISRVRKDTTRANGLNFWCVADNLRKGAALNSVQIAEELVKQGF